MQRRTTTYLLTLIAAVMAVLVTACGSDDTQPGSGADAVHNSADVAFATDMIPHHAQAIQMADMALTQARSPAVVDLAGRIKDTQDAEIGTMSGWLESWGEPVPDTGDAMGSMDGPMEGMMSAEDMASLAGSSGAAFDEMWLTMMIEHHQGAVSMARTEMSDGASSDAKTLAEDIIDAQRAEITRMRQLLDGAGR